MLGAEIVRGCVSDAAHNVGLGRPFVTYCEHVLTPKATVALVINTTLYPGDVRIDTLNNCAADARRLVEEIVGTWARAKS